MRRSRRRRFPTYKPHWPGCAPADGAVLARALFSSMHVMVALGLDEKVAVLPLPVLINQVESMVRAIARGLAA